MNARCHLTSGGALVAYAVLSAASVCLINPLGAGRDEIWTQPKLFSVAALVILNLLHIFQWSRRGRPLEWRTSHFRALSLAWTSFILVGIVATIMSPFPMVSLTGFPVLADGLLYWILIGALLFSNGVVLKTEPGILRAQALGFVFGCLLFSASLVPQIYNWELDYSHLQVLSAATTDAVTTVGIHKHQMPIGLSSHRGYAAIFLVMTMFISLLSLMHQWTSSILSWAAYCVATFGIFFTGTRGAWIALALGLAYLGFRVIHLPRVRAVVIRAVVITTVLVSVAATVAQYTPVHMRTLPPVSIDFDEPRVSRSIDIASSSRLTLWSNAVSAIAMRPVLGWGFNGYGIAWPYLVQARDVGRPAIDSSAPIEKVTAIREYSFEYVGPDGEVHLGRVFERKAHNLVLDWALSVGLVGLSIVILILALAFRLLATRRVIGLEAAIVAYVIFGLTWGDLAQYAHLPWWIVSVGLAYDETDSASDQVTAHPR